MARGAYVLVDSDGPPRIVLVGTGSEVQLCVAAAATLSGSGVAAQVVSGIGFLGAGVIFKEGVNVQGLTTAASVWSTAAVGLLFGLGEYSAGAMATAGVMATLSPQPQAEVSLGFEKDNVAVFCLLPRAP